MDPKTKEVSDFDVIQTMEQYGGNFVRGLARIFTRADPENKERIKRTWSILWRHYEEMCRRKNDLQQ